jgi:hypothetical protein
VSYGLSAISQSTAIILKFFYKNKIKVNICKDGQRFIPENKTDYIGMLLVPTGSLRISIALKG